MARYSMAQVAQRLLIVQAHLDAGQSRAEACRAAGLSPATHKRWLETYKDLVLPRYVLPAPERGTLAFSPDSRRLFVAGEEPEGFSLLCVDAASGAEVARCRSPHPRAASQWREVLDIASDASGERAVFLATGGQMFSWEVASGEVVPCAVDLQGRGVSLQGRAGSGVRRWANAAISPGLAYVSYWRRESGGGSERARLCVARLSDGAVLLEHPMRVGSIAYAIELHPERPLVGALGENKLITVLDFERGKPLLERGPQAHSLSFGPGEAIIFDDWYGKTREIDVGTGQDRVLAAGWGSQASLSDRFITADAELIALHSRREPGQSRSIPFEKIEECRLSLDGRCLAVWADLVCGWDLGAPEG